MSQIVEEILKGPAILRGLRFEELDDLRQYLSTTTISDPETLAVELERGRLLVRLRGDVPRYFVVEPGRFAPVGVGLHPKAELLARLDFVEHSEDVRLREAAALHWELLRFSVSGYFELEGPYPVLVWALPLSLGSLLAEHLVAGQIQIGMSLLESRTSLLITVVPGHATIKPAALLYVAEGETEASGKART